MIVAIYACENEYGGYHGIYDKVVCEVKNEEEATVIAMEMSEGVMESYEDIQRTIDAEIEYAITELGDERDEEIIAREIIEMNMDFTIYIVDETTLNGKNIRELDTEWYNDSEEFLEKYNCKPI